MKKFFLSTLLLFISIVSFAAETVKILAIGNSFSVDAVEQYFHEICKSQGVDVIIGNLMIPGCPIERHYNNSLNDTPDYTYCKIDIDGNVVYTEKYTLLKGLQDEQWDYISFQQVSHFSGIYDTYKDLPALIKYVRSIVGQHPQFMWQMTWAYGEHSDHSGFANYNRDQNYMYNCIVDTAQRVQRENPELKIVIPSGTAVENARMLIYDEPNQLTRDGFHMSLITGRYLISATWYSAIFRNIINPTTAYFPEGMSYELRIPIITAATSAIVNPFARMPR